MVILQAGDPVEALRLKPARLFVIRRGAVIAETAPVVSRLNLGGPSLSIDFRQPAD
jgi:cytosine deaminase